LTAPLPYPPRSLLQYPRGPGRLPPTSLQPKSRSRRKTNRRNRRHRSEDLQVDNPSQLVSPPIPIHFTVIYAEPVQRRSLGPSPSHLTRRTPVRIPTLIKLAFPLKSKISRTQRVIHSDSDRSLYLPSSLALLRFHLGSQLRLEIRPDETKGCHPYLLSRV
jgi:hypothetical protein